MYFCALDPERWVHGRFSFNLCDRVIFGIDPDSAAIKELAFELWRDGKNINRPSVQRRNRLEAEAIVGWSQSRCLLVRIVLFGLE